MPTSPGRYTEWFRFHSSALPEDTFHVVRFSGTEGLNTLFSFTIDLVSVDAAVDVSKTLHAPAVFTVLRDGNAVNFSGYPARVEQAGHFNGYTYYTVELRPTFWKLSQIIQSRIFLNANLETVVKDLLSSQAFFSFSNEFRFQRTDYPVPEFTMQYRESICDYLLWRLEEQGAYFFFKQSSTGDTVVFADSPQSHTPITSTPVLSYSPATGLEGDRIPEIITSFTLSQTPLPRQVIVRSYDWKNPTKPVIGSAVVSPEGLGDVYLADETVETDAEAERLARIRAEELLCRSRTFYGVSAAPNLSPGFVFTLERHYNPAFNREYLVTSVTHEGSQEAYLSLGLGIPLHNATDHHFYRNNFVCIESDVAYRPSRTAPRSRIHGLIRAFVDGAGTGSRAEMDTYGRYKLLFPFDISGRGNGGASCWVRMAQQQAGYRSGTSFPLLPGTEVAVSFLDGNPDRPVITGSLPNGETGALTGQINTEYTGIRTAGGNQITFNDSNTHQGIALHTASGHGMTMTSGSADTLVSTTDMSIKASGVASTEIANIAKSVATGFRITNAALAQDPILRSMDIINLLLNASSSTCSTLAADKRSNSESNKTDTAQANQDANMARDLTWSADSLKLVGLTANVIADLYIGFTAPYVAYGASVVAAKDVCRTQVQVVPSKTELISSVLGWFAARFTSFGLQEAQAAQAVNKADADIQSRAQYQQALAEAMDALYAFDSTTYATYAGGGQALSQALDDAGLCAQYNTVSAQLTDAANQQGAGAGTNEYIQRKEALTPLWENFCANAPDQNNAYYINKKTDAVHEALTSSLTDLLPEITTMILLLYVSASGKKQEKMGGVLLRALDSNINMYAKNPVSAHSASGILLNTLLRHDPSDPPVGFSSTYASEPVGSLVLNSYNKTGLDMSPNAPLQDWGTNDLAIGKHWSDFMTNLDTVKFTADAAAKSPVTSAIAPVPNQDGLVKGADLRKWTTFLSSATDLLYQKSRWTVQQADHEHYIQAQKYLAGTQNNRFVMEEPTAAKYGGISLTVKGKNQREDRGYIALNYYGKKNYPYSRLRLAKNNMLMIFHADGTSSEDTKRSLSLGRQGIVLEAGQDMNIGLSNGQAWLGCPDAGVVATKNDVYISGKNDVQIQDIHIKGGQITGTNGGILEFCGGAIKINGTPVPSQLAPTRQTIRQLTQEIKTNRNEVNASVEELKTRIEQLEKELTGLQRAVGTEV